MSGANHQGKWVQEWMFDGTASTTNPYILLDNNTSSSTVKSVFLNQDKLVRGTKSLELPFLLCFNLLGQAKLHHSRLLQATWACTAESARRVLKSQLSSHFSPNYAIRHGRVTAGVIEEHSVQLCRTWGQAPNSQPCGENVTHFVHSK